MIKNKNMIKIRNKIRNKGKGDPNQMIMVMTIYNNLRA